MPTVELNGERLFYIDRGTGIPIVMVHGAGGNWRHWALQVRDLADAGLRAIALDLPGHGRSGGPGYRSIEQYAASVSAFLESRQLERVVLAGHSMGGAIVQWLALYRPARLAGVALVGTGARLRVHPALLEALERGESSKTIGHLIAGMSRAGNRSEQLAQDLAATPPDRLLGDFLACERFDLMDEVQQIDLPTLIIGGEQDRMTPPRYSRYLAQALSDAHLHLLEAAGHMMMLETPEAVSRALITFANRIGDRSPQETKAPKGDS